VHNLPLLHLWQPARAWEHVFLQCIAITLASPCWTSHYSDQAIVNSWYIFIEMMLKRKTSRYQGSSAPARKQSRWEFLCLPCQLSQVFVHACSDNFFFVLFDATQQYQWHHIHFGLFDFYCSSTVVLFWYCSFKLLSWHFFLYWQTKSL